jgi:hypothetical protein
MEKKRKERDEDKYGEYRKCDLIHGSAAEIARVWSATEKVLSSARFSTHPTLLEGILFLQLIKKNWSKFTVPECIKLVKEKDSSERFDGFVYST